MDIDKMGAENQESFDENYPEQYNANQDFAIFAHKNQAVGGLMSLAEKQNIAEDIIDQRIDSETSMTKDDKAIKNLQEMLERLD